MKQKEKRALKTFGEIQLPAKKSTQTGFHFEFTNLLNYYRAYALIRTQKYPEALEALNLVKSQDIRQQSTYKYNKVMAKTLLQKDEAMSIL